MTEATQIAHIFRDKMKPYGLVHRVETPTAVGFPDAVYLLRKVYGFVEFKLFENSGLCPQHLSVDQLSFAHREAAYGGKWHLLGKAKSNEHWILLNAAAAQQWRDRCYLDEIDLPFLNEYGSFPLRKILDIIAPLSRG